MPYRDRKYATHYNCIEWWAQHFDATVPERFRLESPILDVGCGTGEKAVLWVRKRATVVGLDIADYCIDWCGRHRAEEPEDIRERLHFLQADIRGAWPLASQSFPSVFCSDVLEHLPEAHDLHFFQEIARVLMPGGKALVIVPCGDAYESPDHIQRFQVEDVRDLAEGAGGFVNIQVILQHSRIHTLMTKA